MNTATAALIAALLAFAAAPVGVAVQGWSRSRDKQEDWRRQDEVARRVTAEAERVAEAAAALQNATETQIAEARSATHATHDQLNKITEIGEKTQRFVDGAYTAQLRVELTVQQSFAAMTRTNLALIRAAGDTPSAEINELLAVTDARIGELKTLISERTAFMDTLAEVALAALNAPPCQPTEGTDP